MSSELRNDPLTDRQVVINPGRARKPQEFGNNLIANAMVAADCRFCKGNEDKTPPEIFAILENGSMRKDYRGKDYGNWLLRVIPDVCPILDIDSTSEYLGRRGVGLLDRMDGYGAHELIIECPSFKHLEIADYDWNANSIMVEKLFWLFKDRMYDLSLNPLLKNFLIFKDYKLEAGTLPSHPHCQLIAMPIIPSEIAQELRLNQLYYKDKTRCLLCDMIRQEIKSSKRIVLMSNNLVVLCPYASRFSGEMLIAPLPDKHSHLFHTISDELLKDLANVFTQTMKKLRVYFDDPPYNWVLHSAPVRFSKKIYGETIEDDTHWHIHILPRITKIAGFEIGSGLYINPSPPEKIAEALRNALIT